MIDKMPTVFISHGPPSVLLTDSPVTGFLKELGQTLPVPKSIVCISAHFEAYSPLVTSSPEPELIYDFGGPPQLFSEQYPVKGAPELAESVLFCLNQKDISAQKIQDRGLDHGVWIPLKLMYPEADIPVVQISIQTELDASHHYELGKALSPLREKGVLILGSGGSVHNLDEIHKYKLNDAPPDYVNKFDGWLEKMITGKEDEALIDFLKSAPEPLKNHPYPSEHFLPLLVCLAAGGTDVSVKKIHSGFMYGSLSMAAYQWD